jgi:hypothetical protein
VPKRGDVARTEEIEATRAQETWDAEGGRRAPRPDEAGAGKSPSRDDPPASRRVGERRRGDRRR